MLPILSFKLLPNGNSDGVGTSLVKERSFNCKMLDNHCVLMLSSTRFAFPKKVTFSVQVLMTLDNWSFSSLPEMFLLFLRFIRSFVSSQMENAPLRTSLWLFALSGPYYNPDHLLVLAKSFYYTCFPVSQNSSGAFSMFLFSFGFSKEFFKSVRILKNVIRNIC